VGGRRHRRRRRCRRQALWPVRGRSAARAGAGPRAAAGPAAAWRAPWPERAHCRAGARRGVEVSVPGDVHAVLVHRYGADYMVPRYMDKGRDHVEQGKLYARLLSVLGAAGLRV
jgi:hypothetical protein